MVWRVDEDHECVALRKVELQLRIGIEAHECRTVQRVEVEIELYRRRPDPFTGGIETCLDYRRLHRHLTEVLPRRPQVGLLEELAEELVRFGLEDPRVEACRVVLRKPEIYAGRAVPEVSLFRRRK